MTNREYIVQKMAAFGVNDAMLEDIGLTVDLDADYTSDQAFGKAFVSALEESILMPYRSNINENGFSVSWNRDGVGRWYQWLCRKYGVTPDDSILSTLGVSVITEITDRW